MVKSDTKIINKYPWTVTNIIMIFFWFLVNIFQNLKNSLQKEFVKTEKSYESRSYDLCIQVNHFTNVCRKSSEWG